MQQIQDKDPIEYIIWQENLFETIQSAPSDPQNEADRNLLLCYQAWDNFRSTPYINKKPNIDSFSISHICNLIIPFYIARWNTIIRDDTHAFHLKPALVYITAFVDQMKRLNVYNYDTEKLVFTREQIISQLSNSGENSKIVLKQLLIKSVEDAEELRIQVQREIEECLKDPVRAAKLQDISIANDSQLVYRSLVIHQATEEMGDMEDLLNDREQSDVNPDEMLAESRYNYFENAQDLFDDENSDNIEISNPLTFIPHVIADFKALQRFVATHYQDLTPEERVRFAKAFFEASTKNLPSFIIKKFSQTIQSLYRD
ncbi:hypothetical protein TVAG_467410 [Trichomonas vaginalis G3]|uniref:Uncharacterized protein n=1 Tax=Trichomonas vaginalis (strain ATCC PRA-98 / G3) TaxID=412133 RepID=A2GAR8_TRIV3|nr:hypothetical protein TVAGG3_0939640 [Trichomonas vaginalis G3]EAX85745.1 hypothetical protein TVAG_467410 [Trichomonas vaginalis G3]KAI5486450.1 hypothetical protein TVAGG3_0939640 [Trichomonas vaginalis G3]|eukprot:XP_001298675.1 hypothetical protein [Trichomonas vaginalis G3]